MFIFGHQNISWRSDNFGRQVSAFGNLLRWLSGFNDHRLLARSHLLKINIYSLFQLYNFVCALLARTSKGRTPPGTISRKGFPLNLQMHLTLIINVEKIKFRLETRYLSFVILFHFLCWIRYQRILVEVAILLVAVDLIDILRNNRITTLILIITSIIILIFFHLILLIHIFWNYSIL